MRSTQSVKRIIIIILINIFLFSFLYAEVDLDYSANADEYVRNILDKKIEYHRSGLLYSEENLFDEDLPVVEFPDGFDNPLSLDELKSIWNDETFSEYQIDFSMNSQVELAEFIGKDLDNDFNMKFNKTLNVINFQRDYPEDQVVLDSIEEYINRSREFINEQLPVFKGRIEFENSIVEYKKCLSTPEGGSTSDEIMSVHIRYRRLLYGRILSNNVSYIQISLTKSGNVTKVMAKWPKLIELSSETTEEPEIIISSMENFIQNVNCPDPEREINLATVEGIALCWREIIKEDKAVITPVYSYLVRLDYSDGSQDKDFFDVSVLQYMWDND